MILKKLLKIPKSEPHDSYKMDSYKKSVCTVSDIHNFSVAHNMKLNPTKCKEMLINILHNDNLVLRTIIIAHNTIECVTKYKILGVVMNNKLTWNDHVDYIMKKSSKKLYFLGVLQRAGVEPAKILKVYLTTIRSVMDRNTRCLYSKPYQPFCQTN